MKERSSFSGKLGFILAAAGSAVGLGNIWRFPYLAAKYGGGIFVLIYLILVLTFGYTMIMAESAIGRKTRKSPVGAFAHFGHSLPFKLGGWINAIIPMLIVPYYSVIGGWVFKYLVEYLKGNIQGVADGKYFQSFISNGGNVEFWFLMFSLITLLVIFGGVQNGIEKVSKIMMPILVLLAFLVAGYSITRSGALAGVKYFLVPDFKHFSLMTVVTAMGQMFYSLSIAMGILITFGSYMKKDMDIEEAAIHVEIFDTIIALLAGLMIIPAVFAFSSGDLQALNAGPSLMFITIPKVFAQMGFGRIAGIMFFMLVLLAALTSSIALSESVVSTFEDELGWDRKRATVITGVIVVVLGSLSSLGFSSLSFIQVLGMGILDFFDFITNSIMMPIAAMACCLLVVRVITIDGIAQEIQQSSQFKRRPVFNVMIKYICPIFITVILISSILNVLGIISM